MARQGQRLLDALLHQSDRPREHRIAQRLGRGHGCRSRGRLQARGRTLALEQQMIGDLLGQRLAVMPADPLQHHVEDRALPGTGQPARAHGEKLGDGVALRIDLAEALEIVPMDRDLGAVQQTGGGEDLAPRLDAAELRAIARQPAQPGAGLRVAGILLRLEARQHEDGVIARRTGDGAIDGKAQAAAGPDRPTLPRQAPPGIERAPAQPIGDEQGLDRRRQPQDGEGGGEEESHIAGIVAQAGLRLLRGSPSWARRRSNATEICRFRSSPRPRWP